jgi:glutaminyl-tRNA synthetase
VSFSSGKLLQNVTNELKWADGADVRTEAEAQIAALLGPKTAADEAPLAKKKVPKEQTKGVKRGGQMSVTAEKTKLAQGEQEEQHEFPAPAANAAGNKPHLLAQHLAATGGKVVTRFPPEPNGYLHIGHAKAMFLDFGYGKKLGKCILRFDDTNPEAESQEYIDSIIETVKWMGHEPAQVTYSSDYFGKLHELAIDLIRRGKAYVCHQTAAETSEYRRARRDSPWRDTSVAENLRKFEWMRVGGYSEGEAWLRMKIDMKHDNPCMRDPCAYRIKYTRHPHAGDSWCIWPSYDFTHCLVDSLENITHSLCTLEFDIRRESYYWLIDALDMYRPLVWEFSRLQFEDREELEDGRDWLLQTTLSKRRLLAAVNTGKARGWSDPRMPTLSGLKRRGFTASSINSMVEAIGVSRATQKIPFRRLESALRADLDGPAERRFAVQDPLRVVVTNFDKVSLRKVTLPNHPLHADRGSRELPFTAVVFIERSDFRLVDDPDYYGLAPNKTVGLRYACNITCDEVVRDASGVVTELRVTCDPEKTVKTKGHIHWLPDPSSGASRVAELRLYEWLFHTCAPAPKEVDENDNAEQTPAELAAAAAATAARAAAHVDGEGGDSDDEKDEAAAADTHESVDKEIVVKNALVESGMSWAHFTHYQFERLGYFVVDPDTDQAAGRLVVNRTTLLKESSDKKKLNKKK